MGFLKYFVIICSIYSLAALGLNLQLGVAGLSNFGYVIFLMAGAYTSALLTDAGYSFFVGAIAAIAVSAIIGGLLAWPTKKLRQEYWAIVTLAAGEILRIFIKTETWLAGGTFGLSAPQPLAHLLPKNLYFLFFVIVGVTTVVLALFFLNYLI